MRATRVMPTTVLLLGLSVAACTNDTTGPSISLSQAEVSQLFSEVSDAMSSVNMGFIVSQSAGGPAISLRPGPNLSPMPGVSATVSCPNGGTASAVGNFSGTTAISFDVTVGFSACKTTNFTVGGALRFFGSASQTQTTFSLTETVRGTLNVNASNGRSGSCAIDFTITVSGSPANPTIAASGMVCGINASGTVT
jgi:hypothetical protein